MVSRVVVASARSPRVEPPIGRPIFAVPVVPHLIQDRPGRARPAVVRRTSLVMLLTCGASFAITLV